MKLPSEFYSKMEQLLGDEFPFFIDSYTKDRYAGMRANRLKLQPEKLQERLPYIKKRVAWTNDGFYYDESSIRPAKHPYYYAGLYYLQEPSAMLPAELLDAKPGERILDLCAAPGGKSIQVAAQMAGEGLLVSNDIHPQRARVLLKNLERYGVTNAIVLNESPDRIAEVFGGFFDRILIDAPCSGEGMFRKEPEMMKDWSPEEVAKYSKWQKEILQQVPKLLRKGGSIVYSTCTFSKEENEQQINQFIRENPSFELDRIERLWPHRDEGEGHFAARLLTHPMDDNADAKQEHRTKKERVAVSKAALQGIAQFSEQVWGDTESWRQWLPKNGALVERQGHILVEHEQLPSLKGLRVLRSGWLLGTFEKERFRPSQAFALGLPDAAVGQAVQICNFHCDTEQNTTDSVRYLRGETIQLEGQSWNKGWHLVCVDGFPLGWAKGAGSSLKNEYPPGWRWEDGGKQNG